MSIELTMVATLQEEKQIEDLQKWILEIAISEQMDIKYSLDDILLQVCPEGLISIHPQGLEVTIASDCSIAGPGYFAFVYAMYQEIAKMEEVEFQIVEEYEYLENLDFEDLKYNVFYPELQTYRTQMQGYGAYALWNEESYMPIMRPGFVITPLGFIDMKDFLDLDDEELGNRFFVWNNLEQDASFYKNAALALLWKKCYFEYSLMNEQSEKTAVRILDYIEKAYDEDSTISLPVDSYRFLCEVLQSDDELSNNFVDMDLSEVGYLDDVVHIYYNNWQIPTDGRCDRFIQKGISSLTLSAPFIEEGSPWTWQWVVRRKRDELAFEAFEESFRREGFLKEKISETDITHRIKVFDEVEYYHIMALVEDKNDTLVVDVYLHYEENLDQHIESLLGISLLPSLLS